MVGMKATKKNISSFVRNQLSTNPTWAVKALVRIYTENQTEVEKLAGTVEADNGIGFTGTDGVFLSSLAKQYQQRGNLSPKQMVFVMKKMPKYHAQVVRMSDMSKLEAMVAAANI